MRRKNHIINLFDTLVLLMAMAAAVAAGVPRLISYQGQLNDAGGVPVNATVTFTFSIYDVATGGTALWSEVQTIPVTNGLFNVQLGSVQGFTSALFEKSELYLGIKAGADAEMTPRQRITSSAYSQRSELTPPVVPQGSKTLNYIQTNPPGTFAWSTLGTVPSGMKWIVTNIDIIHECQTTSGVAETMVWIGDQYALGIPTVSSTAAHFTKRMRLSWPYDVGPVVTAGQNILAGAGIGSRIAAATIQYIEVPDSFPTKSTKMLFAQRTQDGNSIMGTVPAGKRWRVVSTAISAAVPPGVTSSYYFFIGLNGTATLLGGGDSYGGYGGYFDTNSYQFEEAPILTEGQTVTLEISHDFQTWGFALVVEE